MSEKQKVYILVGRPYAGKSTLGKVIAEVLHLKIINLNDIVIQKKLDQKHIPEDKFPQLHKEAEHRLELFLKKAKSVIYDVTPLTKLKRNHLKELVLKYDAQPVVINVYADRKEIYKRWKKSIGSQDRLLVHKKNLDYAVSIYESPDSTEKPLLFTPNDDVQIWIKNNLTSGNTSSVFRSMILQEEKEHINHGRHILLTQEDAIIYQQKIGGEMYHRIFFDYPLETALGLGYKISKKGFFETTHAPAMKVTASTINEILQTLKYANHLSLLDLFTGTGQSAWAFGKAGFTVTTCDIDQFTIDYAKHNIKKSGISAKVDFVITNAIDYLNFAISNNDSFSAIFLDPAWNGNYVYDLRKPFFLENTKPAAKELLNLAIEIAPIVALKVPQSINQQQIREYGEKLNCKTFIQYQDMSGYEIQHNPAVVYFIKGKKGHVVKRIFINTSNSTINT